SGEIRVLFSVSDTGTGIPEDKIRDIFQPFVQVDGSMTRGHQGAGLGLAIVRRLVGLMGGNLSLESAPNEGTVVHFVLTLGVVGEGAEEKRHDDIREGEDKGAGLAILLVEDDKINQLSVTGLLEKLGHRPEAVFDGKEALAALERRRFDLVLMDIQLPDMDGIETTRRIRSHDGSVYDPKIPVVALTAHAMAGDRERFLDAGLDDYLAKPVGIEDLKAVLGRFGPTEGEGS
ncbi:MAG: response regulator, partial [Deltaproteobacteria bacterium]|nr:response regulator [Deltaproteobacteria bacterium]